MPTELVGRNAQLPPTLDGAEPDSATESDSEAERDPANMDIISIMDTETEIDTQGVYHPTATHGIDLEIVETSVDEEREVCAVFKGC